MVSGSKITLQTLLSRKREGCKIPVVTCYDYTTARLIEETEIDAVLVGDTYGEVCLGHSTTLPVAVGHLVTITQAVRRGAPGKFLIGDMPYLSYQVSSEEAIRNAGRFMAQAGCDCVKVEVDRRLADTVAAMSRATIPVMAHLGLKPQSFHQQGGYRCQGKTAKQALAIIEDAKILEDAGAVAFLLEGVPTEVARIFTERTTLPVIGCAAGPHCDGTVVVLHDMLGYTAGHPPRSIKRYAELHRVLLEAFQEYVGDIAAERFPRESNSVSMPKDEYERLNAMLAERNESP
ncbi:MAG: 3-methyl-2-oxobutanoate hydroxymethyltransferase [Phycisphaerae bacterium]|nr:3-methyl-2-oxobutanoate hydroxymethyltransferase [Phycisphaerae bacterium]